MKGPLFSQEGPLGGYALRHFSLLQTCNRQLLHDERYHIY